MCENKDCELYEICKLYYGDVEEGSWKCKEILRDNDLVIEFRVEDREFGKESEIEICEVV